jgi:hypothetical protein
MSNSTSPLEITIRADSYDELVTSLVALASAMGADNVATVDIADDGKEAKVNTAKKPTKAKAKPKTEDKAPEASGVVTDMPPAAARDKGIAEMQQYFGTNPNAMPTLSKLQAKYKVKMFSEIPDGQATDFLADVLLIVNGTPDAV